MFKALKKSIEQHKKFSEDVKSWTSEKLFSLYDASSRCTCDFLIEGKIRSAISVLSQYVIIRKEIDRRISEV